MATSSSETLSLSFSKEESELFSSASHDRNPLHCSELYARKTAFAEPVVFGALGTLACLGCLSDRPDQIIEKLSIDFFDALRLGTEYQLSIDDREHDATLKLHDGRKTLMHIDVQFQAGQVETGSTAEVSPPRSEAADRGPSDLQPGTHVTGIYVPAQDPLRALMRRYRLAEKGFGSAEVSALCLASFLVGMEFPGLRALFSRLLLENAGGGGLPVRYEAKVLTYDQRFDQLRTQVRLFTAEREFATLRLDAFVRTAVPPLSAFPSSNVWAGKVALVVGASRGLGAALAQGLAWQGCTVFGSYFRSSEEAESVSRAVAEASGKIILIQGDAADLDSCERMRQEIAEQGPPVDVLICSACPPLRNMWIDAQSANRIGDYVRDAVRLVCTPMSVFLPLLAERGGQMSLISSAGVNTRPAEWPHYISAKYAVEGLVHVAANEYGGVRFLIARPPRLLTDLTNTPLGRQRALPADQAANVILARLRAQQGKGLELLEEFA